MNPAGRDHLAELVAQDAGRLKRIEQALRNGWSIRYDGARDEFAAVRGEVRARKLDDLLDEIEVPGS